MGTLHKRHMHTHKQAHLKMNTTASSQKQLFIFFFHSLSPFPFPLCVKHRFPTRKPFRPFFFRANTDSIHALCTRTRAFKYTPFQSTYNKHIYVRHTLTHTHIFTKHQQSLTSELAYKHSNFLCHCNRFSMFVLFVFGKANCNQHEQ